MKKSDVERSAKSGLAAPCDSCGDTAYFLYPRDQGVVVCLCPRCDTAVKKDLTADYAKQLAEARAEIERMKNCENCAVEKNLITQPPCYYPWGSCQGTAELDISGWQPKPAPEVKP